MQERDYVLGTHDSEVERLGLQHRVWQTTVLDCWRRAGIKAGSRVLDVGAGPGYATLDLAELVGPKGEVIALERSSRFVEFGKAACLKRGLNHVRWFELDLMAEPLPAENMDAAWCRWVASFVSKPDMLVARIARAVKPGGIAIFHEYVDYDTFRLVPPSPAVEEFKQHVGASWRANGGEPDIARQLPTMLAAHGFKIRSATPKIFCARPGEELWSWPASWIKINSRRLQELKQVDEAWVRALDQELAAAEANPNALLLTPLVLEIIAEKVN
jgi:ubiquinone/menaquinone biosynthesis C-methylase UbiE